MRKATRYGKDVNADTNKTCRSLWSREWVPAAFVAAALVVSAAFDVPALLPRSPCIFRNVTGLPCPGCGMTRGFTAMSRGQFEAAVRANPLSPAAYVFAIGYVIFSCLRRLTPGVVGLVRVGERTRWFLFALTLSVVLASWSVTLVRHFEDVPR